MKHILTGLGAFAYICVMVLWIGFWATRQPQHGWQTAFCIMMALGGLGGSFAAVLSYVGGTFV